MLASHRLSWVLALPAWLLLCVGGARAHADLVDQLPRRGDWARGFDGTRPRASVRDGYLYGHGRETHRLVSGGRLRIDRVKTYTRVEHPDKHLLVKLPERWTLRQTLILSPSLRLVSGTTKLDFKTSIDDVLEDYDFSDEHERFFEWDRSDVRAVAGGTKLRRVRSKGGQVVEEETYDYAREAVPIEIVGVALSAALHHGVDRFEYDLLLPDGSTHGVKVDVVRTRNLRRYAEGYGLPRRFEPMLEPQGEVALMDMRLASPIKRLVFPHHFYLAYVADQPENLLAFWGGKPGEHLYAFRMDREAAAHRAGEAAQAD